MSSATQNLNTAGSHSPLRPRVIVSIVLLAIAALFVITSLRATAPGYGVNAPAHDDRPLVLPDR